MATQDARDEYLLQVKVSPQMAEAIRDYADRHKLRIVRIHTDAMQEFLVHRQAIRKARQLVPYLLSPRRDSVSINVRMMSELEPRVRQIAEEDNVAIARVVYTALMHWAIGHKIIKQTIGTIDSGSVSIDSGGPRPALKARG